MLYYSKYCKESHVFYCISHVSSHKSQIFVGQTNFYALYDNYATHMFILQWNRKDKIGAIRLYWKLIDHESWYYMCHIWHKYWGKGTICLSSSYSTDISLTGHVDQPVYQYSHCFIISYNDFKYTILYFYILLL